MKKIMSRKNINRLDLIDFVNNRIEDLHILLNESDIDFIYDESTIMVFDEDSKNKRKYSKVQLNGLQGFNVLWAELEYLNHWLQEEMLKLGRDIVSEYDVFKNHMER